MLTGFKTGAVINAIPLVGNRGVLRLQLNWLDAPRAWNDFIEIHAYMGGDPIEPDFGANFASATLGQGSIQVALADTAADVALKTLQAIGFIMSTAVGGIRWFQNSGELRVNPPTRFIMVSPRTMAAVLAKTMSGAFGSLTEEFVDASVRPFIYAGCRPGPQVVYGDRFTGYNIPVAE
jgi:hypothetical protein